MYRPDLHALLPLLKEKLSYEKRIRPGNRRFSVTCRLFLATLAVNGRFVPCLEKNHLCIFWVYPHLLLLPADVLKGCAASSVPKGMTLAGKSHKGTQSHPFPSAIWEHHMCHWQGITEEEKSQSLTRSSGWFLPQPPPIDPQGCSEWENGLNLPASTLQKEPQRF